MTLVSCHLATTVSTFHVLRVYDNFYCSLHTYVAGESRTFNLKLGCTNGVY